MDRQRILRGRKRLTNSNAGEGGSEEFYGFSYSEPSTGPWAYGTWDPNTGYGFGDPQHHGLLFDY